MSPFIPHLEQIFKILMSRFFCSPNSIVQRPGFCMSLVGLTVRVSLVCHVPSFLVLSSVKPVLVDILSSSLYTVVLTQLTVFVYSIVLYE